MAKQTALSERETREIENELVQALRSQGRMSRRQLQERLGWTRSTVRDVLRAAVEAGIAESAAPLDMLLETATDRAASLAHLGNFRENVRRQKERTYGENAAINNPHGPAHMLRNHQ